MKPVGFVMLCHTALDRAAQVARHWAERGCPVVIHVDSRVSQADYSAMTEALSENAIIRFSRRFRCSWGTWSLVAATQAASEVMLKEFPGVRHVYLASGSCLPLRPVEELCAYLDARPETDFIESVTSRDVEWTVGGLNTERFHLRFPFSWKRQRKLFDWYVNLQRRIGYRRRVPEGITPHLGSQWWCLTRTTLAAILSDPRREEFDRYFRRVWIPDESYFQTLARLHARTIESRSLTLAKFDHQGKPHVFYDDHLHLLRRSDCFVARKAWPRANRLYDTFLASEGRGSPMAEPDPGKIDRVFTKALEQRVRGRAGLYMSGRFPLQGRERAKTAAPYSVFHGFADLFEGWEEWLSQRLGTRVHGRLFDPARVRFAGDADIYAGCLSAHAKLRDYNPEAFLVNLVWNTRGERQVFQFSPADEQRITGFLAYDPHASISVITGAWAVPLFHDARGFDEVRRKAAQLQKAELGFMDLLRRSDIRAEVRIWTLTEFLDAPMENLQSVLDATDGSLNRRLSEAPKIRDLTGFGQFLQQLKNQGMNPVSVGDFPMTGEELAAGSAPSQSRPYLVR